MSDSRFSVVANPQADAPASDRRARRENNFDALRLAFAICIVVTHSYMLPTNGPGLACFTVAGARRCIEVENAGRGGLVGFFGLGGYLICGSYLTSRSVWSYFWKRLLRIEPLFLTMSAVCLLVVGPLGSDDPRAYFRDLHIGVELRAIATLHLSNTTAHTFPHNLNHLLDGPMWTLPLEFAMYVLVAILGRAALLRSRWPVVLFWIALVVLHVLIARFEPHWSKAPRFAQGSMQTAVPFYLVFVGGVLIRLYPTLRQPWVVAGVMLLWAVTYLCGVGLLCGYVFAPSLIIWMGENRVRLPRPRSDLSYGLYLSAWPVQQLLLAYFSLHAFALTICTLAISGPLSMLSWRFIERPALRLKDSGGVLRFRARDGSQAFRPSQ